MADKKDKSPEIARDLGAGSAGAYVAQERRRRSARKKAKKPSGLPEATLSADQRHEAQARAAKRRRRSSK